MNDWFMGGNMRYGNSNVHVPTWAQLRVDMWSSRNEINRMGAPKRRLWWTWNIKETFDLPCNRNSVFAFLPSAADFYELSLPPSLAPQWFRTYQNSTKPWCSSSATKSPVRSSRSPDSNRIPSKASGRNSIWIWRGGEGRGLENGKCSSHGVLAETHKSIVLIIRGTTTHLDVLVGATEGRKSQPGSPWESGDVHL